MNQWHIIYFMQFLKINIHKFMQNFRHQIFILTLFNNVQKSSEHFQRFLFTENCTANCVLFILSNLTLKFYRNFIIQTFSRYADESCLIIGEQYTFYIVEILLICIMKGTSACCDTQEINQCKECSLPSFGLTLPGNDKGVPRISVVICSVVQ